MIGLVIFYKQIRCQNGPFSRPNHNSSSLQFLFHCIRLDVKRPVVNVIKVTKAVAYGRKAPLTAVNSVLDVIKHFYGHILR